MARVLALAVAAAVVAAVAAVGAGSIRRQGGCCQQRATLCEQQDMDSCLALEACMGTTNGRAQAHCNDVVSNNRLVRGCGESGCDAEIDSMCSARAGKEECEAVASCTGESVGDCSQAPSCTGEMITGSDYECAAITDAGMCKAEVDALCTNMDDEAACSVMAACLDTTTFAPCADENPALFKTCPMNDAGKTFLRQYYCDTCRDGHDVMCGFVNAMSASDFATSARVRDACRDLVSCTMPNAALIVEQRCAAPKLSDYVAMCSCDDSGVVQIMPVGAAEVSTWAVFAASGSIVLGVVFGAVAMKWCYTDRKYASLAE